MTTAPLPTDRELAILEVLWRRGEATVREVYEDLREDLHIVQNTVQAFLRTMAEKELVEHHTVGRSFVYRALVAPDKTRAGLLERVLERAYGGALDQLVEGAIGLKNPSHKELKRIRDLLDQLDNGGKGK
ncbi:MAG: BlaI family penicillinase repressor [Planctomycetota bacterium]|jgi:BlaI family penicillinase repressor